MNNLPLVSREFHSQPKFLVFAAPTDRLNANRTQTHLFTTFPFDEARSVEVEHAPRGVIIPARVSEVKERTRRAI